jgi:hypothetical protein
MRLIRAGNLREGDRQIIGGTIECETSEEVRYLGSMLQERIKIMPEMPRAGAPQQPPAPSGSGAPPARPQQQSGGRGYQQGRGSYSSGARRASSTERATPKQLDLIADLAKERGRDVLQEVRQMGLGSLQELTRGEASKIIDALQGR